MRPRIAATNCCRLTATKREILMTKDELITKHKQYIFKCVTTYYKDPW